MKSLTKTVLNRILELFSLSIEDNILMYNHKMKYGRIQLVVTKDLNKVIDFLELPYTPSDDTEDLFYAITNSPYFNSKFYFNRFSVEKGYQEFLKLIKDKKPVNQYRGIFIPGFNSTTVDRFFGVHITQKINNLKDNGMSQKALRSRFNGHLVKEWTGLPTGPQIAQEIEEFKIYMEERFKCNFLDYLAGRAPKIIRKDFLFYYHSDLQFLDIDLDAELPFL